MVRHVLAVWFLLASFAYAQTHTPSLTVDGAIVTVDADVMWFDGSQDITGFELREGTYLTSQRIAASTDGSAPIIWSLPSGSYTVTAHGFPDDPANPDRTVATLVADVLPPTRTELIASAVLDFFTHRNGLKDANDRLETLAPTLQELIDLFSQ